jgi:hypothetical protein
MRLKLKDLVTFCFASFAAAVPWAVRGELLADARHQRRREAAEILRAALQEVGSAPEPTGLESYRTAVSRAIQVAGADSFAASELGRALRETEGSDLPPKQAIQLLRRRVEEICETLEFAPTMEAELPQGFPPPTPAGEVEIKRYPAYRMAQTASDRGSAFWTLFNHIKRKQVAMTAPVEMSYQSTATGEPKQRSMAFLYGSLSLGETGSDGSVRVVDVEPQTVLSIGVRGDRTRQKLLDARQRLTEWINANSAAYQPAGQMRVMGYNSPFVPRDRRYFEVQIPVTTNAALAADGQG